MSELPVEGGDLHAARLVVLFEQPQSLAHHFAGRVVPARADFRGHKLFEFRSERDVHEGNLLLSMLTRIAGFVNPEHRNWQRSLSQMRRRWSLRLLRWRHLSRSTGEGKRGIGILTALQVPQHAIE